MTNTAQWDAIADRIAEPTTTDTVVYGEGLPTETDLRLLGSPEGLRLLDLGCGTGQAAVCLVRAGAHVIGIDCSEQMLRRARRFGASQEVTVEWRHADMADLAFLRAEAIDAAVALNSLSEVDDIDRVFRQVNRVLKPGAPFVFTLPHPAAVCTRSESPGAPDGLPLDRLVVHRDYCDDSPVEVVLEGESFTHYPYTIETVFAALGRASYRVDHIIEPQAAAPADAAVPPIVIWRARKQGN